MKKQHQTYIAIGVGCLFIFFIYFKFLLGPVNKNISEKRKRINELITSINSAKRESANLENFRIKLQLLEIEFKELQNKLPKNKEIPDLLRIITKDAQMYDVKILNIQPQGITDSTEYKELRYSLNVKSNLHSLCHFFAKIGQEDRLLSTQNLSLNSEQSADKSITCNGSFILIAYLAK